MTFYEVTPQTLNTFHSRIKEAKEGLDYSNYINMREPAYMENGIGFVHIYGMLGRDLSPIEKALGNTSYDDIMDDCEAMLEAGAKCIVFEINSGGGQVSGAIECAEFIRDLPVPTIGYFEGLGCSAAYKLASGMSYLIATKSATIGNIGAILVYVDESKALDQMGYQVITFVNDGAIYKSIGHNPTLTPEQETFLKESINETGYNFKQFVLENRPELNEEVFKAGWYSGISALSLGLCDAIGTEDLVLETALQLMSFDSIAVIYE